MPKIDKDKLLEWLNIKYELSKQVDAADEIRGIYLVVKSGTFDIKQPEPPQIQKGDIVRHRDYPHNGIGEVLKISKSGKRAQVKFEVSPYTPYGYYGFDKLIKEVSHD